MDILSLILLGAVGGSVRALVGVVKYLEHNKPKKGGIRLWYLIFTLYVAAVVGGLAGVLTNGDWRLALIAGYAGVDFLEGLYKIKNKQDIAI